MISVGMGTNYDLEQLREMATDPDSQNMFKAEFDALGSLVTAIVQSSSKGRLSLFFSSIQVPSCFWQIEVTSVLLCMHVCRVS